MLLELGEMISSKIAKDPKHLPPNPSIPILERK
jgi:hypothetical protein